MIVLYGSYIISFEHSVDLQKIRFTLKIVSSILFMITSVHYWDYFMINKANIMMAQTLENHGKVF